MLNQTLKTLNAKQNRLNKMTNLIFKGQSISQSQDGYLNGSEMAKANNVRINDWTRTDDFKRYQTAISAKTGIPAMFLVKTSSDSTGTKTTWLHPDMAIKFGRWISVVEPVYRMSSLRRSLVVA